MNAPALDIADQAAPGSSKPAIRLIGSFDTPGDKSVSHRMGLMALVARGACRVRNYSPCDDCRTTLRVVKSLGVGVMAHNESVLLKGAGGNLISGAIDCGNSGTTMRLIMGILAGVDGEFLLTGDKSLSKRPMRRVAIPLSDMGARVECTDGHAPVSIRGGGLKGCNQEITIASAQLKSALLLAGLSAKGRTVITEPAQSRDHTERMLKEFGGKVTLNGLTTGVEKSGIRLPEAFRVPGDPSSAAFPLCAAAVIPESRVTAKGVMLNPTRLGFIKVLRRMGALVSIKREGDLPEEWGRITVAYSPKLRGCVVNAREIPLLIDEVPVLALVAAMAGGETVFKGISELKVKESDRVGALTSQLGGMGVNIKEQDDNLVIRGGARLVAKNPLDSFGDHRIAMTLRLALMASGQEGEIKNESCAAISFPQFQKTLEGLIR